MCSLNDFHSDYSLSDFNQIPLCVIDGQVKRSTPDFLNLNLYTTSVSDHPRVVISKDVIQQSLAKTICGEVFLPGSDSLLHRIQDAWYESGFERVLEILEERDSFLGNYLLKYVLLAYKTCKKALNFSLACNVEETNTNDITKDKDLVVCIAWHPHSTKLAVATRDDTVTIYSTNSHLAPVLKAKPQRRITSLAWRPLSTGELAVACSAGVYIWNIDRKSGITRPSFSSSHLLPDKYVTCIVWSPQGDILMTCNARDNFMLAWDPDTIRNQPLKRAGGGGVSHLSWSPDGSKMLAATTSKLFRVWTTSDWSVEKWHTAGGPVTSSVWSSKGDVLLFATQSEPLLFSLHSSALLFQDKNKSLGADVVADLTKILVDDQIVGGDIKDMAWDPTNSYLAIIFWGSPIVVVFYTKTTPSFSISPGFFVRGLAEELPSCMNFQNNFSEGANLTICWSSGRVQYFPICSTTSGDTSAKRLSSVHDKSGRFYSFS